ncbi:MAG: ABC transporter ATP-binding protein [Bacteroidia bacterium]|nr:ABC transporter ATP-binding protein [Bacteroidia bacterium]
MKSIIEFRNIGKRFFINSEKSPYLNFRENVISILKNPLKSFRAKEEFWALKNITFEVMPGESIGIIGKNGAGKSTLLKILSRITPPTEGEIKVRGRVASLLEVGTGFHPELTGRENVFFNGAILGMKRTEIRKKFDEMVDFAGVEKFIDMPLKHYSSGMQLRLAFAVAAFLEAEILVVDEVLAVGDAEFQKKCLGKMEDVTRKEGRTVLFVSHNLGQINLLCKKSVLLENGHIVKEGESSMVTNYYLNKFYNREVHQFSFKEINNSEASLLKSEILDIANKPRQNFKIGEKFKVRLIIKVNQNIPGFVVCLGMIHENGLPVRNFWTTPQNITKGIYEFTFEETDLFLGKGTYGLTVGISSHLQNIQYYPDAGFIFFSTENLLSHIVNPESVFLIANKMSYQQNKLE